MVHSTVVSRLTSGEGSMSIIPVAEVQNTLALGDRFACWRLGPFAVSHAL
jgi:hypothetical protein